MRRSKKTNKDKIRCAVAGCSNPEHSRGLCSLHYSKAQFLKLPTNKGYLPIDTINALLKSAISMKKMSLDISERIWWTNRISSLSYTRYAIKELAIPGKVKSNGRQQS